MTPSPIADRKAQELAAAWDEAVQEGDLEKAAKAKRAYDRYIRELVRRP